MVLSRDWDIQREQRILSAIRDGLLADPRIARVREHPREETAQSEVVISDSPSTAPNAFTVDQTSPLASLQSEEICIDKSAARRTTKEAVKGWVNSLIWLTSNFNRRG